MTGVRGRMIGVITRLAHRHRFETTRVESHSARNQRGLWVTTCGSDACNGLTIQSCRCGAARERHASRDYEEVR